MALIKRIHNFQISEDARVRIRVNEAYESFPLIAYYPYGLSDPMERWKCRDCVVILPEQRYEPSSSDSPCRDFPGGISVRAFSVHEADLKELRKFCLDIWATNPRWFVLTRNEPQQLESRLGGERPNRKPNRF